MAEMKRLRGTQVFSFSELCKLEASLKKVFAFTVNTANDIICMD